MNLFIKSWSVFWPSTLLVKYSHRVMECWVCSPEAVTQLFRLQLGFSQPFTSKAEQDILADKMKWLVIIWKPYFYQVNHWCFFLNTIAYYCSYFCNELKNQGVSFEEFPLWSPELSSCRVPFCQCIF